jgi:ankyrin repeat protein
MKATVHHFEEIIELLLNAGANVNAKNEEGKTALKIAYEYGYQDIIELLKKVWCKRKSMVKNYLPIFNFNISFSFS